MSKSVNFADVEKDTEQVGKIIMVTGGQRSGKSEWAERKALSLSSCPVYVATATVWDDDFRARVESHKARRGPEWTNIEETLHLSSLDLTGRVVLVDCVTLWATNMFFAHNENIRDALEELKQEFDTFTSHKATYIFVTNEIGLGGVSENAMQRHFADLQGKINQYIASRCHEAYLMVSGLELKLK